MPRIMPEPRYFSIPSIVVGGVALRNRARNWTPCVRSLDHSPLAWMNSPAEIVAAWPTTVMRSRLPRALTRRTQKPFSSLWNVTRSTSPAKTSVLLSAAAFKRGPSFVSSGALPSKAALYGQARRLAEPPVGVVVIARRLLDGPVLRLLHRLRQRDASARGLGQIARAQAMGAEFLGVEPG